MAISIVICDDHQVILESLELLISTMEGMNVAATFSDASLVPEYIGNNHVDVLITDLTMPVMSGIDLTLEIRKTNKKIKILMLTVEDKHFSIRDAYHAGISGYILKRAGRVELESAIHTVYEGKRYFSNAIMDELLSFNIENEISENELPVQLSNREIEIVKLIAQEFSSNEIARLLFLSPGTVETHRHNILRKLQVKNSIGIIKYALKNNLI